MKKIQNIIIGLFFASCLYGQQDAQYSHNMFNQMTINPAYAGSQDMICINALNRNQWLGPLASVAPRNMVFSANAPFTLFEKSHGGGLTIINDRQGIENNIGLKLAYAFRQKMKVGDGILSGGISFGFLNKIFDGSKLNGSGASGTAPTEGAIDYISSQESPIVFDFGLGVYYKTEKVTLGISTNHPTSSMTSKVTNSPLPYYMVQHYYISGSYKYLLSNPMYELVPSFFIQSDGRSTSLNLNTNLVYNNRMWGGLSYRAGAAVTALFGLELMSGIKFGVAYDYDTSDIGKVSNGSLEVAVIYGFKLKKEKIPQRYKSIRFL
jgi:type IX secretion system PorP/SprF family membrane protein